MLGVVDTCLVVANATSTQSASSAGSALAPDRLVAIRVPLNRAELLDAAHELSGFPRVAEPGDIGVSNEPGAARSPTISSGRFGFGSVRTSARLASKHSRQIGPLTGEHIEWPEQARCGKTRRAD
ncbi:hypothetical protein GCM10010178_52850 [Lentzea flava]|uniref:Uncharacterized protein n=1 Tax=Lentzea flava TaxID=103732 RepID=A0ABQ2UTT1_9PSEU|nr:hypothetical protein GCM10010178_52850 [Lentzea flava]